jgi:hypothetical protein
MLDIETSPIDGREANVIFTLRVTKLSYGQTKLNESSLF